MKCEECNEIARTVCIDCEENFCIKCSLKFHSGGKRRFHNLKKLCEKCLGLSNIYCNTCEKSICNLCQFSHISHSLTKDKKLYVYWDYSGSSPRSSSKISSTLSTMNPSLIKVYGRPGSDFSLVSLPSAIIETPYSFFDLLLKDIQNDAKLGLTQAIIISRLSQNAIIKITSLISNIELLHFDPITLQTKKLGLLPIWEYLVENFETGKILLTYEETVEEISRKFSLDIREAQNKIDTLANDGKIIKITKELGEYNLQQVSLKINEIDPKVFLAVLRSLKRDEIFPSEKAIQSRIREGFNIKYSHHEWNELMKKLQKSKSDNSFTLFAQNSYESLFKFSEIVYEEEKSFVIYPKGEQWASSDQFGDIRALKQTRQWADLLSYLSNYFTKEGKIITLTGGKYGCALLLKHFSTSLLKELSLGKLSFMVQVAINDDILRYQKTLLIYTANYPITLSSKNIGERVNIIRNEIIRILKGKPQGLPLAQIPIYLKRKMKFPLKLSELGFKKLKDLLKIIPEITLHPANSKNPSAFLNMMNATVAEVQKFITEVVEKNTYSVKEEKLCVELFEKFGKINWNVYKSKDLIGFIDEYCKNVKVMKVGNECILMGRETEKEELSISTHNSEYFVITDNEDKCTDFNIFGGYLNEYN
ncbi:hypothetical protein SteCoe_23239 [Stentor coeruleus]|uniref:B box-type domain-containing protein n=1 Tax=Stentor coeruleus TaxID=5963 RepID=A0A1R2BKR0_9CILI|nr:hypothetical protein SteCoe_23239 [Stentor coeruleus]